MGRILSLSRLLATSLSFALLLGTLACAGISGNQNNNAGSNNPTSGTPPSSSGGNSGGGSSGSGGGSGSGGTSGGNSSPAEFLYVLENNASTANTSLVQGFAIGSGGSLSAVTEIAAGTGQGDIIADNPAHTVIAGTASLGNGGGTTHVYSFAIGSGGTLTSANTVSIQPDDELNSLLLDASGTNLYASLNVLMSGGTVRQLSVDLNSGQVSDTGAGAEITNTDGRPGKIVMSPNGRFVYAALLELHHVPDVGGWQLFLRDTATGTLTSTGNTYHSNAIKQDDYNDGVFVMSGKYLVATERGEAHVFAVDQSTGALSELSLMPLQYFGDFAGVAADKTGNYVVLTHNKSGAVESYKVNADGSLTLASSAAAAAGITYAAFDQENKYVYVQDETTSQIFAFTFDAGTGALAPVSGSPVSTTTTPVHLTVAGK